MSYVQIQTWNINIGNIDVKSGKVNIIMALSSLIFINQKVFFYVSYIKMTKLINFVLKVACLKSIGYVLS